MEIKAGQQDVLDRPDPGLSPRPAARPSPPCMAHSWTSSPKPNCNCPVAESTGMMAMRDNTIAPKTISGMNRTLLFTYYPLRSPRPYLQIDRKWLVNTTISPERGKPCSEVSDDCLVMRRAPASTPHLLVFSRPLDLYTVQRWVVKVFGGVWTVPVSTRGLARASLPPGGQIKQRLDYKGHGMGCQWDW